MCSNVMMKIITFSLVLSSFSNIRYRFAIILLLFGSIFLNNFSISAQGWSKLNGPKGTIIRKIYPNIDENSMKVVTHTGVYGYNSSSHKWTKLTESGFYNTEAFDLCQTTADGIFAVGNNGVFKSLNLKNWINTNANLNYTTDSPSQLIYDKIRKEIWMTTSNYLASTKNLGESWNKVKINGTDRPSYIYSNSDDKILIACKDTASVAIYDPQQNTWAVSNPILIDSEPIRLNYLTSTKKNIFYGIGLSKNGNKVLFSSLDALNWTVVNSNSGIDHVIRSDNSFFGISKDNGIVFESNDDGKTWKAIYGTPFGNKIFEGVFIGNNIYWGTEQLGFLVYDANTKEFQTYDMGLSSTYNIKTSISPDAGLIACAISDLGISLSSDQGKTWSVSNKGLTSLFFNQIFVIDNLIILLSQSGINKLHRTENGGLSWEKVEMSNDIGTFKQFCRINDRIFAITDDKLYQSDDFGKSWVPLNAPNTNLYLVYIIKLDSDNLCISTQHDGIWTFSQSKGSWSKLEGGLDESFLSKIALNPKDNSLWCVNATGFYTRKDNQWKLIRSLDVSKDNILDFDFNSLGTMFYSNLKTGIIPGIMKSSDGGKTGIDIKDNTLFNTHIVDLVFDQKDNLFATTHGDEIFTRNFDITAIANENLNSTEKSISVYPNPSTNIFYITTESNDQTELLTSKNSFFITDCLGRNINDYLSTEIIKIGINNTLEVDLSNFADGIYFLHVANGSSYRNAKIIKYSK